MAVPSEAQAPPFSHVYKHICILSCFSRVQLFATLWTVTHQTPLSMGFSRQEYWNELLFPPPVDLPNSGMELASLALTGGFFTAEPLGNPIFPFICVLFNFL